jgi:cellulose synthase operon protein C
MQAQCKTASAACPDLLARKVEEALRLEKFKDAIELLKQLVKQDPRPHWRDSLADAYIGRAKVLAAKGMFKEAEIVLGNAAAAGGTVKEPLFLLQCLIRQGQFQKALAYSLKHLVAFEAGAGTDLTELIAALFCAFPTELEAIGNNQSSRAKWIESANAARDALNGWMENRSEADVDALLAKISLRSPFKAVRLFLKSMILSPHDPVKARRLLEGVSPDSPFTPLRLAVEAALPREPGEAVDKWSHVSAAQQNFAIEASGLPAGSSDKLIRLLQAERGGPAALFAFVSRQAGQFPAAQARSACLNLLPRIPDRIALFEKTFGPLREWEKQRILAIAAQEGAHWRRAEKHWSAAAMQLETEGSPQAKLSAGVIYRHLADRALEQEAIEGQNYLSDPQVFYLKKSLSADPDHLPALLRLLDLLSKGDDEDKKEWHTQADAAARRFPRESAVLLHAIDSAAGRKAYKKAAGFAQKLLVLDPINQQARQRMIDLQIAHARKQMRRERADLAAKELDDAAQWEHASRPNAALRINQGLVGLCRNQGLQAEARLRAGVELAGGGAIGWFRAALEEGLLAPLGQPLLREELAGVLRHAPKKQEIVAIAAAMGAGEVKATAELTWKFCAWLRKATDVRFSTAEFHPLAALLLRTQYFDILGELASEEKKREPEEPAWRFYQIVARTRNNPELMSVGETRELIEMRDQPRNPRDFHWRNRIQRYFDSSGDDPAAKRRAKRIADQQSELEEVEMASTLEAIFELISPRDIRRLIRAHGKDGAPFALTGKLVASPVGRTLPRPALARIASMMVEMVGANPASSL